MRFELKILILLTAFLAVSFSILNAVSISVAKLHIEERLKREAELYSILCEENPECDLPDYFVLSGGVILSEEFQPVARTKNATIMVNRNYLREELKKLAIPVFLWEVAILAVTVFALERVITHYLKREKSSREYLELVTLALAHKIGNFLSLQRINLEIIEKNCGRSKATERLKEGYGILEKDSRVLLESLKRVEEPEKVDLAEIARSVHEELFPGERFSLHLERAPAFVRKRSVEDMIFFIMENALRYSKSYARVRTGRFKGCSYVAVYNDIASGRGEGSGIGLELVRLIAEKNKGTVKVSKSRRTFYVSVFFRT